MLTVLLWLYLSAESTRYGIIWFVIGIGVLLWITRFFRRPLTINMGEDHPLTRQSLNVVGEIGANLRRSARQVGTLALMLVTTC